MSKEMKTGYLIFISILLHNLPEGLAIGSSFMSTETLGMTLAIVIGIHNIPEGLATKTCTNNTSKQSYYSYSKYHILPPCIVYNIRW